MGFRAGLIRQEALGTTKFGVNFGMHNFKLAGNKIEVDRRAAQNKTK